MITSMPNLFYGFEILEFHHKERWDIIVNQRTPCINYSVNRTVDAVNGIKK